ncbi:hypothetical protein V3C99_006319, partial [Haemonchus contortus]
WYRYQRQARLTGRLMEKPVTTNMSKVSKRDPLERSKGQRNRRGCQTLLQRRRHQTKWCGCSSGRLPERLCLRRQQGQQSNHIGEDKHEGGELDNNISVRTSSRLPQLRKR